LNGVIIAKYKFSIYLTKSNIDLLKKNHYTISPTGYPNFNFANIVSMHNPVSLIPLRPPKVFLIMAYAAEQQA
jgi:hypothetical protein